MDTDSLRFLWVFYPHGVTLEIKDHHGISKTLHTQQSLALVNKGTVIWEDRDICIHESPSPDVEFGYDTSLAGQPSDVWI